MLHRVTQYSYDYATGRNYNYTSPVGYAIANLEGQTINYDSVAEGQGEAVIMVSSLGLRLNVSLKAKQKPMKDFSPASSISS